jgi:transposase
MAIGRPKGSKNGQPTLLPVACERCGKIVLVKPSLLATKRFCSRVCVGGARQDVICAICGTPFAIKASQNGEKHYCSPPCFREGRRRWQADNPPPSNKPDRETLDRLYTRERLSTRQIAEQFGVSHMSVKRWLRADNITRRPASRGLAHRGQEQPTRDELQRLVHHDHKSFRAIGEIFGVDATAVAQWVTKHGLTRPTIWGTRRKGHSPTLPTATTLRDLYERGLSTEAIGHLYGVSTGPILRLCREHGIELRPAGWNGLILCEDGHRVRSSYEFRVDNWLHTNGIAHQYEPVTPFDRRCRADFLANGWYIEIWGVTTSAIYRARRDRKRRLYAAHDLPLIEIGAHAFDKAHDGLWERRLAHCLTPSHRVQLSLPLQIPA